jgi:hypothetical protein
MAFREGGCATKVPATLDVFYRTFSSEQRCWEVLRRLRWPDGFRCPRCEVSHPGSAGWQPAAPDPGRARSRQGRATRGAERGDRGRPRAAPRGGPWLGDFEFEALAFPYERYDGQGSAAGGMHPDTRLFVAFCRLGVRPRSDPLKSATETIGGIAVTGRPIPRSPVRFR